MAGRTGLDGEALVSASRLTAHVDNNAIADGSQTCLHGFIVTVAGKRAVVQQGMNEAGGTARRYHWHSTAWARCCAARSTPPGPFRPPPAFAILAAPALWTVEDWESRGTATR